jgi:hypothetical protein
MAVRFFGTLNNYSGYGNATRNFAEAFSMSNIPTKFSFSERDIKINKEFCSQLNNYGGRCKIDFYLHCPPYGKHRSNADYKIAYFYWEADRLPSSWSSTINRVDEIWAPCELVKRACVRANFRGKIKVVPTPHRVNTFSDKLAIPAPFSSDYIVSDDVYKFYSIFQWHNRKGYRELLNAYFKAFNSHDNVILIVKTNTLKEANNTPEAIRAEIYNIKRKLNLKFYPPVYLSVDRISLNMIAALHNTSDCYVSPHHGEGWGMPIHDAMIAGNQIITTKFGGVTEYLDHKSAHIIKHSLGPVTDMSWSPLYGGYQNWAYPSINHLTRLFKDVYSNHNEYQSRTIEAQKIANLMTVEAISKRINREISKI